MIEEKEEEKWRERAQSSHTAQHLSLPCQPEDFFFINGKYCFFISNYNKTFLINIYN
jgi:hypothetical protein